ncbi:TPA: phage portal protein [Escherichia coli]
MNGELVDLHGQPLRQSMGYSGGGTGFGGQLAEWLPAPESADVALLPSIQLGNARADDLVRNNGIAANAVEIHKDHIVGHMFRLSYRPNWRWLGMSEADSHAFIEDVEAAWMEFCDPVFGSMDVEGRRSFTEFIREGVGVHTFNGEIFVQPVWDTESTSLFRTKFKTISPKRVSTPGYGTGDRFMRAGVEINRYGKALAYHVQEDDWPGYGVSNWTRIAATLPSGRPGMIHVFQPQEDGQTRGANQFYSVMERLKMLDTLQATQLQSAVVRAMYAATIESTLDSEKAFEYIAGVGDGGKNPLNTIMKGYARYYATNTVKLGGVRIPHLYPGDSLNLQTAQNADNGFSELEKALLRYIAAGLGVSYEQLSRDYSQVSYSSARASDWDYREGERQGAAGGAKGDKKSGKVGVRYFDARDGRTREVKVDVESTDKRHPFTQPDQGTAKHCAESKVKRVQKVGRQMTITLPCRPELLKAGAEMRFVTQGFGVREDHHWQAESVEFSLVPGQGFTLNLSLTTDISAKGKASGKKKGVNYFG